MPDLCHVILGGLGGGRAVAGALPWDGTTRVRGMARLLVGFWEADLSREELLPECLVGAQS